ncbi:Uncharacterised protein [Lelliottia amnigena]|nr:Uncharacterised protein [Lelliottia amnigena]
MPVNENIDPTSGTRIKPDGLRLLTIGEIALAKTLFGGSLIYSKIWVHRESYLPFNLQPIDVAMTPNGELWFREETYSHDFSLELVGKNTDLCMRWFTPGKHKRVCLSEHGAYFLVSLITVTA